MNKGLLIAGIIMILALAGAGAVLFESSVGVSAEETYTGGVALFCDPTDPNCEPNKCQQEPPNC
jgi:hypothetical protein